MQQWALDMEEPSPHSAPPQPDQESAEASTDILQEAAALDEQGRDADADETAASQQGSQETADSFQETGQLTDCASVLDMLLTYGGHAGHWNVQCSMVYCPTVLRSCVKG